MKRAVFVILLSPLVYVAWWHVAFAVLCRDAIDVELYSAYVRQFLFGPGGEIPTVLRWFAIVATVVTVVVTLVIAAVRSRRSSATR